MSFCRHAALRATRLVLRQVQTPQITETRNIKRWVAPVLKQLKRRMDQVGPEAPTPRSSYLEWNYEAEIFAFGKRLREEFDRKVLKQALTHRSYVTREEDKAKEKGLEFETIECNHQLIKQGGALISQCVRNELGGKYPKDVVEALHGHLTTVDMLAHVGLHLGLKDIVQTAEFPVENETLADTFKAVVAALEVSQGQERVQLFVKDFLLSQLNGKDVYDVWAPDSPLDYLRSLLPKQEIESRLCNKSAVNTILANYQVGLYCNKKLLGLGWGESVEIAKDTAALDAIQRLSYGK
ncbi:large ribosomal subunit protein mL44 [Tribolium castaneum]|uniref:Large ribosomal subunit protein mL44 n=1 Tax=Tribolium castaneum TaxID=7070 RepID=D2A5C3_TRICA|nr:PREDICTED: 39S ribosomal protein L44, mitochondrial [Tribolium castaneum]EFA05348.1 39S ribosomal protein L44, mitochondrial-like Protein [Tribolium castaneum]|eukprot:XP_974201.1 PREDICTED: 39S ribosomal protein L44, mitochondrial [Tribolium castaneum]